MYATGPRMLPTIACVTQQGVAVHDQRTGFERDGDQGEHRSRADKSFEGTCEECYQASARRQATTSGEVTRVCVGVLELNLAR